MGGWFVDRLGSRRMIIFCGIIWVIATMATGFVGGFISLFLARLLLGVGKARRCLLRRERSPTGSSRSSVALFRALRTHSLVWEMRLLPIIVALVAFWSWRGAFISLAIVTFIWLISWIISYKDDPRVPQRYDRRRTRRRTNFREKRSKS
ncbi:hypothetical protein WBU85_21415 [Escherichia coli]